MPSWHEDNGLRAARWGLRQARFRFALLAGSASFSRLSEPVDKVKECQNRVPDGHPGTCISHNVLYPGPHGRFITVDRTMCARCLGFLKRALCQPGHCIGQEFFTVGTQRSLCPMVPATKDSDHCPDGFFFPYQPRMLSGHKPFLKIFYSPNFFQSSSAFRLDRNPNVLSAAA